MESFAETQAAAVEYRRPTLNAAYQAVIDATRAQVAATRAFHAARIAGEAAGAFFSPAAFPLATIDLGDPADTHSAARTFLNAAAALGFDAAISEAPVATPAAR